MTSPVHGSASTSRVDATRDRIADLVGDPLLALGLDLEAVEITPAGKRRVLRIAVDTDGGPTMDDVAEATKAVSEILDDSDVMGEMGYTLEVTSRGIDRPLTLPRHWRRNVDRLVAVSLTDGAELTGRVQASDEAGVSLDFEGETLRLDYPKILKAVVQIEFNRPKPAHATPEQSPAETQESDV